MCESIHVLIYLYFLLETKHCGCLFRRKQQNLVFDQNTVYIYTCWHVVRCRIIPGKQIYYCQVRTYDQQIIVECNWLLQHLVLPLLILSKATMYSTPCCRCSSSWYSTLVVSIIAQDTPQQTFLILISITRLKPSFFGIVTVHLRVHNIDIRIEIIVGKVIHYIWLIADPMHATYVSLANILII